MQALHINDITEDQIENTLGKYFSSEEMKSINSLLDIYDLKSRPRLIMACIKLSKGNYKELASYLFHANDYCIEFIEKAENQKDYISWVENSIISKT